MSDPRRPEWSDPNQGTGGYPTNVDPAYSDPAYSGYWGATAYGPKPGYAPPTQPTEQLPPYWQPGAGYPGAPPPPPEPPRKTSRWLWVAAVAAVLLVTGLVLALVIVSNSSKDSTIVAPPSSETMTTVPRPTTSTPRTRVPTRTAIPEPVPIPTQPPGPTATTGPTTGVPPTQTPTGTETVVYTVNGQGRAINITYVDTGGIMQTEFNVALPWSKEVTLTAPAKTAASVAVVNIGRDVTCSVSVNGAQVRQRTGRGLTICTGAA